MIRHVFVLVIASSTAVAGHPCNVNSVFLQSSIPGYVLYQAPQVQYAPQAVGASYQQKESAEVLQVLRSIERQNKLLLKDAVARGTVSASAIAVETQATINKFCVSCHSAASPPEKGFALTDLSQLTADQHKKIFKRIVTSDPTKQMPPPDAVKKLGWDATAAGKALEELSEIEPYVPVEVK